MTVPLLLSKISKLDPMSVEAISDLIHHLLGRGLRSRSLALASFPANRRGLGLGKQQASVQAPYELLGSPWEGHDAGSRVTVAAEQDVTQFVRKNVAEHNGPGVESAADSLPLLSDQLGNSMVENIGHRSEPVISGRNGVTERFFGDAQPRRHIRWKNSHNEVGRCDGFLAARVARLSRGQGAVEPSSSNPRLG